MTTADEWKTAWEERRTPWDAEGPAPALLALLEQKQNLPKGRVFVPGAGSGYDVLALASEDRSVLGLDLSPHAIDRFHALRRVTGIPAHRADMLVDDFFTFAPAQKFDLIWDYTFLCALDPVDRPRWLEQMSRLLADDGELITLIFPIVKITTDREGPPYPIPPELVRELLEPKFECTYLEPVKKSHKGRQGKEWLGRWKKTS